MLKYTYSPKILHKNALTVAPHRGILMRIIPAQDVVGKSNREGKFNNEKDKMKRYYGMTKVTEEAYRLL